MRNFSRIQKYLFFLVYQIISPQEVGFSNILASPSRSVLGKNLISWPNSAWRRRTSTQAIKKGCVYCILTTVTWITDIFLFSEVQECVSNRVKVTESNPLIHELSPLNEITRKKEYSIKMKRKLIAQEYVQSVSSIFFLSNFHSCPLFFR